MTNEQFNLSVAFTVRYLESDNENENRIFRQAEQKVLSCTCQILQILEMSEDR